MSYQKLYLLISCLASSLSYASYWEEQFSSSVYTTALRNITTLQHHSQQNYTISYDFMRQVQSQQKDGKLFSMALKNATTLLEVGCGSGEMLQLIGQKFPHLQMLGIDISHTGIVYANEHNKNEKILYRQYDALNNSLDALGTFNIAVCSNTLEHFKQPFVLLENILKACDMCIILVPYKQPVTDGYEMEGGPGHVYTFDEHSFSNYTVLSWFTFSTKGWSWSSKGEVPLQLAILITKKHI